MPLCDILLTNAIVLTMDEQFTVHAQGAVAVTGDSIVAVGPDAMGWSARETIDCAGRVVMPGLVNAHTHVAMSLLRGLADDLRLDVWLMGYMMPVERQFVSPEFVRLGTRLGCAEMIRSGITCFADMYYFEDAVAEAVAEAGMRALCTQTVLRFPAPDAASFEDGLARARAFIEQWKGHPLIVPGPAPHAPYTCTPEILRACAELAAEFDVPLHIHLSETLFEVEESRRVNGMPVIPWVKKQGLFGAKVLAAHCVHVDEGEMRTLKSVNAGVAHNPTSNLKLAAGIAPVAKMRELGLAVGIGTDGAASNNDLDMFEETRLAALLAKSSTGDPTSVPARDALAMATLGGATALHMQAITGSLQPGKRADLIVLDLNPLHNVPSFRRDPAAIYAQIVYASKSTDVLDVLCNGRWLMRDRALLTLDETALREAAREQARQIDAFLAGREVSVLQKLVAIGGAVEEESFEVQVKARVGSEARVLQAINGDRLTVIRASGYRQHDIYWSFEDPEQGRLRYREDEFLDDAGNVTGARARLTLTGRREDHFGEVLLYRSRYLAPATHSPRFYREYFRPRVEQVVDKIRRRWLVAYRGVEFYVHMDRLLNPERENPFVEVKSRTWSRRDAQDKAEIITDLLALFGASPDDTIAEGYVEMT